MDHSDYFQRLEPLEQEFPLCPVCGDECETVYKNCDGEVIACDGCVVKQDSIEWAADEKEGQEAAEGDRRYQELKDSQL